MLAAALLTVVVAAGAGAWVLPLPFRTDDVVEILRAPERLGLTQNEDIEAVIIFRPLLWTLYAVEMASAPKPMAPVTFYAVSLALHALTAMCVLQLFRRLLPLGAALVGALIFAVHPGGFQALSWIAARGDILATLFGVLAVLAALAPIGRRRGAMMLLCGIALAAALASKVAAVTFPLVVAGVVLADGRRGPLARRVRDLLLAAVPVLLVLVWRQVYLGQWQLHYYDGPADAVQIGRMLQDTPRVFARMLVPWNGAELWSAEAPLLAAIGGPVRFALAAALAALPLLALLWLPPPRRRLLLGTFGVLAFVALPAIYLLSRAWRLPELAPPGSEQLRSALELSPDFNAMNRAFYPLMVPVALVFALALAGGGAASRLRRPIQLAGGILLASVAVDSLVHVARVEHHAARLIRDRVAFIERVLAVSSDVVHVAPIDFYVYQAGVPLLGSQTREFFKRPFREHSAEVTVFRNMAKFEGSDLMERSALPIQIISFDEKGAGQWVSRLPPTAPDLENLIGVRSLQDFSQFCHFMLPVGVRHAAAIRIPLGSGPAGVLDVELVTLDDRFDLRAGFPASEKDFDVVLALDVDRRWRFAQALTSIRITAGEPGQHRMFPARPALLDELPVLDLEEPGNDRRFDLGEVPPWVVKDLPPGSWLRLEFSASLGGNDISMIYLVEASRLDADASGRTRIDLSSARPSSSHPPVLAWSTLPQLVAQARQALGASFDVEELPFHVRAEALTPPPHRVQARSTPRTIHVLLP